jgi:hypothetical protein
MNATSLVAFVLDACQKRIHACNFFIHMYGGDGAWLWTSTWKLPPPTSSETTMGQGGEANAAAATAVACPRDPSSSWGKRTKGKLNFWNNCESQQGKIDAQRRVWCWITSILAEAAAEQQIHCGQVCSSNQSHDKSKSSSGNATNVIQTIYFRKVLAIEIIIHIALTCKLQLQQRPSLSNHDRTGSRPKGCSQRQPPHGPFSWWLKSRPPLLLKELKSRTI